MTRPPACWRRPTARCSPVSLGAFPRYVRQGRLERPGTVRSMKSPREVEFVFEPQEEGGYHVYAPEMPGLHTEGDDLDQATENAREALELYVEGLREDRPAA
jgi:predicted RNase H-like HicB family nuclease